MTIDSRAVRPLNEDEVNYVGGAWDPNSLWGSGNGSMTDHWTDTPGLPHPTAQFGPIRVIGEILDWISRGITAGQVADAAADAYYDATRDAIYYIHDTQGSNQARAYWSGQSPWLGSGD